MVVMVEEVVMVDFTGQLELVEAFTYILTMIYNVFDLYIVLKLKTMKIAIIMLVLIPKT
jgi:hypothetical protein